MRSPRYFNDVSPSDLHANLSLRAWYHPKDKHRLRQSARENAFGLQCGLNLNSVILLLYRYINCSDYVMLNDVLVISSSSMCVRVAISPLFICPFHLIYLFTVLCNVLLPYCSRVHLFSVIAPKTRIYFSHTEPPYLRVLKSVIKEIELALHSCSYAIYLCICSLFK
jgi:hypothetical protein